MTAIIYSLTVLTAMLLQQPAGEDLGAAPETQPLAAARARMRDAHARLMQGDTSPETQQLQQQAVADLSRLIAQRERQLQQSEQQTGATQEAPADPDETPPGEQAGEQAGQGSGGESSEPPSDRTGDKDATGGGALDRAWGHLPERVRQQLQSAAIERFLPKYEDLIEQFYQRLAEDAQRTSTEAGSR